MTPGKEFEAEVLFFDPADVPRATEALVALGCEYKVDPDAIDEHGPTVFGWVTGATELDEHALGDWLSEIVHPLGGDVVEWCLVELRKQRLARRLPRKRHRWKSLDTYLPNKNWECTQCGLHKITEYDSDNLYMMRDGRTWHRFAPPCPPPDQACMTPGKQFEAEVLFLDPADVPRATEVLARYGCKYKVDPDAIDPHGPTVFGWVTGITELDELDVGDWVLQIVRPLGGDVVEWCLVELRKQRQAQRQQWKTPQT
jgi:hypothetical protein